MSLSAGQNFDVACKVVKVNDVEKVTKKKEGGKELGKQELVIGDGSRIVQAGTMGGRCAKFGGRQVVSSA